MTTRARYEPPTAKTLAASAVRATAVLVGRRRAVRATRFASNVLRFDDSNRLGDNGEDLVQRVARSRPGPVVFDVGANLGQWSLSLLAQPGHPVELHAFEPSSYSRGKAAGALGTRANIYPCAMAAEAGRSELLIVRQGAGVNSIVPFDGERDVSSTETVDVDTVDHFCEVHGVEEITLLKIDAEGSDLDVMRGAVGLIGQGRIGIVQFEYNWRWVASRTFLRDAFELIVCNTRYSLGKVTPRGIEFYDRWHHELETFRESNYVLVRDDWRPEFPSITWWGARS